jgi:hypothetical protein
VRPLQTATPVIAALAIALAHLGYFALMREGSSHDPDRFYHFAIARQTAAGGIVRIVPQVVGLGWDKSFADKEFLFHALCGAAYRVPAEAGVVALVEMLAVVFFVLVFVLLRAHASTPAALTIMAWLFWATPKFMTRTVLVRPHILAMVLFVGLALAWQRKKPLAAALCGALFALSYHAVYVPILFLLLGGALAWRDAVERRVALSGAAGLLVGILINPYFPGNVLLGVQSLTIALGTQSVPAASFGAELLPLRSDEFLLSYAPYLWVIVAGWFQLAIVLRRDRGADLFLPLVATVFFGLVAKSPRAIEYAAPLLSLLAARLWTGRQEWLEHGGPRVRGVLVCGFLLALSLQLFSLARYWAAPTPRRDDSVARALAVLPATADRPTILNCEWSDGAEILYRRPDVRFFDLLDPTFLALAAPATYQLREAFKEDRLHDPSTVLHDLLGADYVLCRAREATARMQRDPAFVRVFPPDHTNSPIELYRIDRKVGAHFISDFRGSTRAVHDAEVLSLTPSSFALDAAEPLTERLSEEPPVLSRWLTLPPAAALEDASASAGNTQSVHASDCTSLTPARTALAAQVGSTLLGVGGAGFIRVWRNGVALFDGEGEPTRQVTSLVPLLPALAPGDRLELVICAPKGEPRAATLSFWTAPEIETICRAKGLRPPRLENFAWSAGAPLCIAPLAVGGGR